MDRQICRGEIFWVDVTGARGHELKEHDSTAIARPGIVISSNDINSKPLVVTIVPGGGVQRKAYRNEVVVSPSKQNGLQKPTTFQCHQLRAVDHSRVLEQIGELEQESLYLVERSIEFSLGLSA